MKRITKDQKFDFVKSLRPRLRKYVFVDETGALHINLTKINTEVREWLFKKIGEIK